MPCYEGDTSQLLMQSAVFTQPLFIQRWFTAIRHTVAFSSTGAGGVKAVTFEAARRRRLVLPFGILDVAALCRMPKRLFKRFNYVYCISGLHMNEKRVQRGNVKGKNQTLAYLHLFCFHCTFSFDPRVTASGNKSWEAHMPLALQLDLKSSFIFPSFLS